MKAYIIILIPYVISILAFTVAMKKWANDTQQRVEEAQVWGKAINLENIRVVNIQGGEQTIRIEKGTPYLKINILQYPEGLEITSDTLTLNGDYIGGQVDILRLPRVEIVNAKTSGTVIFEQDTIR